MAAVLGGLLVFALLMVAGLWATVRVQRNELVATKARANQLAEYIHAIEARDTHEDGHNEPSMEQLEPRDTIPDMWEPERDDVPTLVCRIHP